MRRSSSTRAWRARWIATVTWSCSDSILRSLVKALSDTALLLIDLQNDFLHPDGAYARAGVSCEGCYIAGSARSRL
ncbi:MAG: hypothetical protein CM1200mP20_08790 [Pseudomonadota bacterium]|nr:MAG: hypothetical protein CM1200mP20_08790 [Pseudomonadota bacterium]